MRRRYVIAVPHDEVDSPLPGRGLLQEAVAAAVIVFAALAFLEGGLALLFDIRLQEIRWLFARFLGLNMGISAFLALVLTLYRALRFERWERIRLAEVRRVQANLEEREEEEEGEELSRARLDWVALKMLRSYYDTLIQTGDLAMAAHAMSREHLEEEGIKQEEWNIVNNLLKEWGIRDGRKRYLVPESFEEAWRIWVERSNQVRSWRVVKGRLIPQA